MDNLKWQSKMDNLKWQSIMDNLKWQSNMDNLKWQSNMDNPKYWKVLCQTSTDDERWCWQLNVGLMLTIVSLLCLLMDLCTNQYVIDGPLRT